MNCRGCGAWFSSSDASQELCAACRRALARAKTLFKDVETVVRCNMCKYYEAEVGFCHYHDHGMHWDDFCSRGETTQSKEDKKK